VKGKKGKFQVRGGYTMRHSVDLGPVKKTRGGKETGEKKKKKKIVKSLAYRRKERKGTYISKEERGEHL